MSDGTSLSEFLSYQGNRYQFVLKHFAVSSFFSLTFGSFGGMLGAHLFPATLGPIFPYLVTSSAGFGLGSIFVWKSELVRATYWTRKYPKLVEHHLRKDYQGRVNSESLVLKVLQDKTMKYGDCSWLILGAQAASEDLNEIETTKASAIIESYSSNS